MLEEEENVLVKQRMDAVITGLIGGGTISLLVVIGGVVALYSDMWMKFTTPTAIFSWLFVLTALTAGQLFLTWQIVSAFSAAPSQTDRGVAQ